MSWNTFAVREAQRESLGTEFYPAPPTGAFSPATSAQAAEAPPDPPRDVLESLMLHGDCAFLLDLWAL